MNKRQRAHIRKVADHIEANGPTRPVFDMSSYITLSDAANLAWMVSGPEEKREDYIKHPCDTAACMAGYSHFVAMLGKTRNPVKAAKASYSNARNSLSIGWEAGERMGITEEAAEALFTDGVSMSMNAVQAVRVLRALADSEETPDTEESMVKFVRKHKGGKKP